MNRRHVLISLVLASTSFLIAADEKTTEISGVVYQKGQEFVIAETQAMQPIAVLEGVEFATNNFANFEGKTVRIRGIIVMSGDRKILRVKTLADVHEVPPPSR